MYLDRSVAATLVYIFLPSIEKQRSIVSLLFSFIFHGFRLVIFFDSSPSGGMADALDSKSSVLKACGFDSLLGQLSSFFTELNFFKDCLIC